MLQKDTDKTQNAISWEAKEFAEYHKNPSWYATFIFIGLAAAGFLVWQKLYSGAAVVMVAIAVLFSQSSIKPKTNQYMLDANGLTINKKHYSFSEMKLFWSVITPEGNNIYIKTAKKFAAPITLNFGASNPKPIEDFLKKYIPIDEKSSETTTDRISRLFRF